MEILRHGNEGAIAAWEKIHDPRKLYLCRRCNCMWKCAYSENTFGQSHEYNGDPDILCPECNSNDIEDDAINIYKICQMTQMAGLSDIHESEAVSSYRGCKDFDHDDYNCLGCVNPETKSYFR